MRKKISLLFLVVLMSGCSPKNGTGSKSPTDAEKKTDPAGVLAGAAQLGMQSGDVKNIAFATVMLTQQDFKALTATELADASFDVDTGRDAVFQKGTMTTDELQSRIKAKFEAR